MKHLFFLSFPLTLFLVIGVSITALALPLLSSSPIRNTNLIFVFLLLYVLFNESGRVVWIAFASHALRELFSTTPFGIILAAGTLSILFSYWTLRYIFTNRS